VTGGTAGKRGRLVFPALVAAFLGALALSAATGPVAIPFRKMADALLHGGTTRRRASSSRCASLARCSELWSAGPWLRPASRSSAAAQPACRPLHPRRLRGGRGGGAHRGPLPVGGRLLGLPFFAFVGAALSALAVFLLARRKSGVSPERLILMGVVVGAFLNAVIMLMVTLSPPGKIPGRSTG